MQEITIVRKYYRIHISIPQYKCTTNTVILIYVLLLVNYEIIIIEYTYWILLSKRMFDENTRDQSFIFICVYDYSFMNGCKKMLHLPINNYF